MKTLFQKIIVLTLIFIFAMGGFFGSDADRVLAISLDELRSKIKNLKQEREKLEEKAEEFKGVIYKKGDKIESLQDAIDSLEAQEQRLRVEIGTTENKIQTKELEITRLKKQIKKREAEIKERKDMIADLIKSLNRNDEVDTIEVVFKYDDLSELLRVAKDISLLQTELNKNLKKLQKTKNELQSAKQSRVEEKKRLSELKQEKEAQKMALSRTEQKKESYLNKTQQQQQYYQNKLSETRRKKRELFSRLSELEKKVEQRKNFLLYTESGKTPPAGSKVLQWPEGGTRVTQGYGMTPYAKSGSYGGKPHYGVDMAAGAGTPVKAAASGKVIASGYNQGWGNWAVVKHDVGLVSLYGHMLKTPSVSKGERVQAGDIIGYEGSTGYSTGSHLHFSVYKKFYTFLYSGKVYPCYTPSDSCKLVNPFDYL